MKVKTVCFMAAIFMIACLANATEIPAGAVSGDWYASGNPYNINGEINIATSTTLNIHEGVEVIFQGHYKFIVYGFLEAIGTEQDSILFTAANITDGWHSIRFIDAQDSSHLSYCIVQYGRATGVALEDICGGGMAIMGSNPVISHCLIQWNYAELLAGGIATMYGSNPTLSYCMISENSAGYMNGGMGGGWVSSPVLSHCTISGNSADYMGGGFGGGEDYDPILDNCTISGNSTNSSGGGINLGNVVNPTITNCTIINNTSIIRGGGIAVGNNCGGLIENCTITGNTADSIGGGVVFGDDYTGLIDNCTITDNSAGFGGGGIYCFGTADDATISNCIISSNAAGVDGGGIYCTENSSPTIEGCIIDSNTAGDDCGGIIIVSGSNPTISNCIISGNMADDNAGIGVASNASPTIDNCTISENTADSWCGGLGTYGDASPTISNCTFSGNEALLYAAGGGGGGMAVANTTLLSIVTVSNCDFIANSSYGGGGIIFYNDAGTSTFSNCNFSGNSGLVGGGIAIYGSNPTFENCSITENLATNYGGGVITTTNSNSNFSACVISDNVSGSDGGGIECGTGSPIIINCTIARNSSGGVGGGIDLWATQNPVIVNTVVEGNTGDGGIWFNWGNPRITYCDFNNNENGNFTGPNIPPGLGVITGVNANGDSCDVFSNIFEDPLFENPAVGNFQITWANFPIWDETRSPCIDAGDPTSPHDPDGTVADQGAFYFDQGAPDFTVTLTYNSGSPVPAGGGYINFDVFLQNNEVTTVNFDLWIEIPPLVTPPSVPNRNLTFTGGFSITRPDMDWPIPASWPAGNYDMIWNVGNLATLTVWAMDSFPFEKSADDDGRGYTLWEVEGDPLDQLFEGTEFGGGSTPTLPGEFALYGAYPNPFNPTTTIRFDLPEATRVNLAVYDVSGRLVSEVVDGWRDAGYHEVTFDGSGLASGMYFYRIEAGEFSGIEKMVLVK